MTRFKILKKHRNWKLKDIAARLGCSIATASHLRQGLGNKRRRLEWEKVDWHRHSTTEIAGRLGVLLSAVSRKRAEMAPETLVKFKRK